MDNFLEREYANLEEKLGFYFGRLVPFPLVPPDHVYFSLTNRCNQRCKMCDIPNSPTKIGDELPTLKIKDIILQIEEMGIKQLIFSGGEPFLREDFLEILEFAIFRNIEMVTVITNGTLLNDQIIRKLVKLKLSHITISLDGLKDTNNKIRGNGVFEKAEYNIDQFNYYKSRYNTTFPTVGINFIIMDNNIDDMLPMIEFARTKKCNIIVFQPILFSNTRMQEKSKNALWPSDDNIAKLENNVRKIIDLKSTLDDLNIYTDTPILEALPNYFRCEAANDAFKCYEAIKRIVITYAGNLWSCMGVYGNLNEKSLKKAWFSKEAKEMREKVKNCREHCLQDCVYFPSDIVEDITKFSKRLETVPEKVGKDLKDRLVKKVTYYVGRLSRREKSNFLNLLQHLVLVK